MTFLPRMLAAALVLASLPARAEDIDMASITCKEFIASPKADVGTILVWLEGFYTKENDPPILHVDKMTNDAKNLSQYCNEHPDDDIIKAAQTVMPIK